MCLKTRSFYILVGICLFPSANLPHQMQKNTKKHIGTFLRSIDTDFKLKKVLLIKNIKIFYK
jgi:hypothetical protein